jgi:acetolactate synthase-1/2/3 large subunit
MKAMKGSDLLCTTLEELGVGHVFGLPGTQNLPLFESLRGSHIRVVVATSELGASFMANGYFRASGKVGALTTIPGPGFTFALSGIAEARLDSAAVLYIVVRATGGPGRAFRLQRIEQREMAAPIVKRVYVAEHASDLRPMLAEAHALALEGEPGPVLVEISAAALMGRAPSSPLPPRPDVGGPSAQDLDEIVARLRGAIRPLLYVGQGANSASREIIELAELLHAPVVTTTSARGVLPEDHALCVPLDLGRPGSAILNALVDASDLVLALGCKMSHNGAHGFRLRIPKEKLIHADASEEVLGANYPASMTVRADVPKLLSCLLAERSRLEARGRSWQAAELDAIEARCRRARESMDREPRILDADSAAPGDFFDVLGRHLPRESCLTTDSGMHQVLARRHFRVLAPRGFLVPSDFQSMGFGLAAAIGAKLARPERTVVALVGDGGLAMSGSEILTAVREGIPLTVIVFNDGHLGLIRSQQLSAYGSAHGTRLNPVDWELFARSLGATYSRLDRDAERAFATLSRSSGVHLIEVAIGDPPSLRTSILRRRAARAARALVPRWVEERLRGVADDEETP